MVTHTDVRYFNKSAYVSLLCLIAFIVVISICLVKQFIWDSLLSKYFHTCRIILAESLRKHSSIFYRTQSNTVSNITMDKSTGDIRLESNESVLLASCSHGLPVTPVDNPCRSNQDKQSRSSYGSSTMNAYAYTNYGSED
jgi:hypothetical protein